ncbi:hypothetical protein K4K49_011626 [Colletotrichum sp. SAR 10_70]|nr:hypothetical protein KHU50_010774 [Colletotrichum sp. SAR 10_65]KAI8168523.1 hypothetical protein K4K50_003235 [Colletotrichum sp. SAR 10_71]KAI8192087.1 hypothetical protein K4K49_011626 [Colletotrichum sp. SAR 10_70]KAI8197025.1 hypothetical protein K4K52_010782 [Colletotrichum sp. SAR 10_76]KAI8251341.1 hypothetical protein K4K53_012146 [Colletotrichum sp. SAR 10_77]KAJ5002188.1 hypothetical protein K4K48_000395 [Colletotrichum sp. SAR 10_66]
MSDSQAPRFCADCFKGTLRGDVEPQGTEETVSGLPTYVARPEPGREPAGIVVVIPDVFGWKLRNTRALADAYAKRIPAVVLLPEVMNGYAMPDSILTVGDRIASEKSWLYKLFYLYPVGAATMIRYFVPLLLATRAGVLVPRIANFLRALRLDPPSPLPRPSTSTSASADGAGGETSASAAAKGPKIGVAGFCWGGKYAIQLAQGTAGPFGEERLIDIAYTAHPSMVSVPGDLEKVALPLSIANGDDDMMMPRAKMALAKDILGKKGDCEVCDHDASSTAVLNPKLNPIATSRPAPLELPERQPDQSKFSHLFAQAKTYINFYKGGLRAVFANRRHIQDVIASKKQSVPGFREPSVFSPGLVPKGFSRADWVLLWRVRHDILRVPLFGVVLLICGEFTPLIVIFVDGVVPYTCRLPRQLAASFAQAEERRHKSFEDFERAAPEGVVKGNVKGAAQKHVLRSLHLPGMMWDKIGFIPPGMWASKGRLRMAFLEGDDRLLLRDGDVAGLEEQEVRIACTERGIDCAGRSDKDLRKLLDQWLRLVDAEETVERRKRMTVLLTTKTEKWPKNRNFALPEWHL